MTKLKMIENHAKSLGIRPHKAFLLAGVSPAAFYKFRKGTLAPSAKIVAAVLSVTPEDVQRAVNRRKQIAALARAIESEESLYLLPTGAGKTGSLEEPTI